MFRGTGMPVCCCISDLVTKLFPSSDIMLYVSFTLLSRILATFILQLLVRHYCNLITVNSAKSKSYKLNPCIRLKSGHKRFCKTLRYFKAVSVVLLPVHVEFLGNHDLVVNYIILCNPLYFRHGLQDLVTASLSCYCQAGAILPVYTGYFDVIQFNEPNYIPNLQPCCIIFSDIGSIIFLLKASKLSKGGFVSASVRPSDSTNLRIASGIKPLLLSAASVGSRGSSQLLIVPFSISGFIFRFETGIPSNSSLENSIRYGFLKLSLSRIAK